MLAIQMMRNGWPSGSRSWAQGWFVVGGGDVEGGSGVGELCDMLGDRVEGCWVCGGCGEDLVRDVDYIESPDGACALPAADVVARLRSGGGEQSRYCEEVVSWIAANPGPPTDDLVDKALRAVARARGDDSELAELWSESRADKDDWLATVSEVKRRLSA